MHRGGATPWGDGTTCDASSFLFWFDSFDDEQSEATNCARFAVVASAANHELFTLNFALLLQICLSYLLQYALKEESR